VLYQAARDMAYATISDNETDQYFISVEQMESFANKALRELVEATAYHECSTEWTTSSGTSGIAMGDTLSRVLRVEVDYQVLRTTTQASLRRNGYDWREHTGLPRYYYADELGMSSDGKLIGMYPTPDATYNLRVTFVCNPDDVAIAEDMGIPEWCAEAVVWSMLSDIYKVDTEIMNVEVSNFYDYLFKDATKRIRARSYSKLPKSWSYKTGPSDGNLMTIWNNLPEEIPQP